METLLEREIAEAQEIKKATLVRLYHRWANLAEQCKHKAEVSSAFESPNGAMWDGEASAYEDCAADLKALLGLG